jgi:hypothetical protein
MSDTAPYPLLVAFVPLLVAVAVTLVLKQRNARQLQLARANIEKQQLILGIQDEMSRIAGDASLDPRAARQAFDALVAQMLLMDPNGELAPLIADDEAWFAEQLAKRAAAAANPAAPP